MAEAKPPIRGPYRNGIRRRAEILEAAARVFAEFGYAGGSIRTIAAAVGVAPATLLQHFDSKEGLLEAVLSDWAEQSTQHSDVRATGLAGLQATRRLIRFHLEHRGLIELFITLAAEATSPSHPAHTFVRAHYDQVSKDFAQNLRQARDDGDIDPIDDVQVHTEARLIVAALDGLELQWLLDPGIDLAQLYDDFLTSSLRRLGACSDPSSESEGGDRGPDCPSRTTR